MNVTIVQNSAYGAGGLLRKFIEAKGWNCRRTLFPDDVIATELRRIVDDCVVFLGSPRGVYETHVQWIARQRAVMRYLVSRSVPVFGICFGAQLLAAESGGTVAPMGSRYQGWITNEHAVDPVWRGPWLRWHGDFITLPQDAEIFATDQGTVQAFRCGSGVGVQFHPEVLADLLRAWSREKESRDVEPSADYLTAIRFAEQNAASIETRAFGLFEHVFGLISG